ncbi:hypothetical protein BH09BAC5_BH09BAC5_18200 [soil metagenome]
MNDARKISVTISLAVLVFLLTAFLPLKAFPQLKYIGVIFTLALTFAAAVITLLDWKNLGIPMRLIGIFPLTIYLFALSMMIWQLARMD